MPDLSTSPDGVVYMSWTERDGAAPVLRFARLDGGDWSAPRTIASSPDMFVNWADFPSLVPLGGKGLAAHWLQRSSDVGLAYDVWISLSADGGRSWSDPTRPHDDGTATEHGFVSLVAEPQGGVTAIWLDGRNFEGQDSHTSAGAGPEMTLRSARFAPDGTISDETLLDSRICDCCQTSAAMVGDTLLAAYRDRSAEEIRDIWSVRRTADGWQEPVRVAADDWMIPGCPVNGPAVAADGERAVVAWFTLGSQSTPAVNAAFTSDAGASFGTAFQLASVDGDWTALGRVDAAWIDRETVVVAWLAANREVGEIRYRTVTAGGDLGTVHVLGTTTSARSSGFPRVVRAHDRLVVAWTVPGAPARLAVAEIPLQPVTD